MKLTVIGCKTFEPQKEWITSSFLINTPQGAALFDMGSGSFGYLVENGLWGGIGDIFISHSHLDHTSDLIRMLHYYQWNISHEITIHTPPGFAQGLRDIFTITDNLWNESENLQLVDYAPGVEIEASACEVTAVHASHFPNVPCHGFSVTHNNKKVLYSGDSEFTEALVEASRGADLAIYDCNNFNLPPSPGHMDYNDVKKIIEGSQPKKALLTHIAPGTYDPDKPLENIGKTEVMFAKNGMVIEI